MIIKLLKKTANGFTFGLGAGIALSLLSHEKNKNEKNKNEKNINIKNINKHNNDYPVSDEDYLKYFSIKNF